MVQAGTKIIAFGHPVSQPSRAIWAFCELNNIEYEQRVVDLLKGEQKSAEFLAINP